PRPYRQTASPPYPALPLPPPRSPMVAAATDTSWRVGCAGTPGAASMLLEACPRVANWTLTMVRTGLAPPPPPPPPPPRRGARGARAPFCPLGGAPRRAGAATTGSCHGDARAVRG